MKTEKVWKLEAEGMGFPRIVDAAGVPVAEVYGLDHAHAVERARLMLAAPGLRDAAAAVLRLFDSGDLPAGPVVCGHLTAAGVLRAALDGTGA